MFNNIKTICQLGITFVFLIQLLIQLEDTTLATLSSSNSTIFYTISETILSLTEPLGTIYQITIVVIVLGITYSLSSSILDPVSDLDTKPTLGYKRYDRFTLLHDKPAKTEKDTSKYKKYDEKTIQPKTIKPKELKIKGKPLLTAYACVKCGAPVTPFDEDPDDGIITCGSCGFVMREPKQW